MLACISQHIERIIEQCFRTKPDVEDARPRAHRHRRPSAYALARPLRGSLASAEPRQHGPADAGARPRPRWAADAAGRVLQAGREARGGGLHHDRQHALAEYTPAARRLAPRLRDRAAGPDPAGLRLRDPGLLAAAQNARAHRAAAPHPRPGPRGPPAVDSGPRRVRLDAADAGIGPHVCVYIYIYIFT